MLDDALANADARRRGCALMMIDLDRFKQVNDTLGHPIGDKLLKKVAERLTEVLGEDGQVGRLGGDEFEAILPGIEEEGRLAALAGRLIEQVSRPYKIEGHEIRIGTSVGIAVARPGKTYADGLIKDADLALYAAKDGGRGTFRFFAPGDARAWRPSGRSSRPICARRSAAASSGSLYQPHRQFGVGGGGRLRGPAALAASGARAAPAAHRHPARRGERADGRGSATGCCGPPAPRRRNGRATSGSRSICRRSSSPIRRWRRP